MDYKKIGFKAGLEIHQQLDTHKLFCNCDSVITDDIDYSFERVLRPTQSEMGDVDKAALAEAEKNRRFLYTASDRSTCLVEADEEPPHTANSEAVDLCLTMALLLDAKIVDEIQFMRKIVIDGSNTTGFQRTALVAMDGEVDAVGVQTIALEEDAARKIKEKDKLVNYGLDRLGIPLIEIATDPDIKNPVHAREIAERIGMLMRATGRVKRGLGSIRQDLNVSIREGGRVEIKGVQSLSSISKVAEKEACRQLDILEIQKVLGERVDKSFLDDVEIVDLTSVLQDSSSDLVSKKLGEENGCACGIRLPGFDGLLKREDSRIGKDLAVYAGVVSGLGGIIHSDELPGYGLNSGEVKSVAEKLQIEDEDAFVFALGSRDVVEKGLKGVLDRAKVFFDGVHPEVRRALGDDSTEYMRPLPGAERMYPETDVPPIKVTSERIQQVESCLPERPEEKRSRFMEDYGINEEQTKQLLNSGYEDDFEKLVEDYPGLKNVIIRTFLHTFPELKDEGVDVDVISVEILDKVFSGLSRDMFAKEAVFDVLKYLCKHPDARVEDAVDACGLDKVSSDEVEDLVKKIVEDRKDFVEERGMDAVGPLMGVVMKELRGKADGEKVSKILKEEIKRVI